LTEEKQLKTGTTTVGMLCRDAVVIASEQKATMGYLIESKLAKKVHKLDDHIGMTIAGSVGDAQSMIRLLKAQFKLYKLERGPITVRAAATLMSNILHGNKYFPYLNMFLLAGYDSKPRLYSLDPIGGSSEMDKFYSTGSGSPFVYGVMEDSFRENMSVDEAVRLVLRAIKAAIQRDIASGGKGFLVAVIDKNGYRELSPSELKKYGA